MADSSVVVVMADSLKFLHLIGNRG